MQIETYRLIDIDRLHPYPVGWWQKSLLKRLPTRSPEHRDYDAISYHVKELTGGTVEEQWWLVFGE